MSWACMLLSLCLRFKEGAEAGKTNPTKKEISSLFFLSLLGNRVGTPIPTCKARIWTNFWLKTVDVPLCFQHFWPYLSDVCSYLRLVCGAWGSWNISDLYVPNPQDAWERRARKTQNDKDCLSRQGKERQRLHERRSFKTLPSPFPPNAHIHRDHCQFRCSRARKPWSAICELKHWNFRGWKCLIHGLHFTV